MGLAGTPRSVRSLLIDLLKLRVNLLQVHSVEWDDHMAWYSSGDPDDVTYQACHVAGYGCSRSWLVGLIVKSFVSPPGLYTETGAIGINRHQLDLRSFTWTRDLALRCEAGTTNQWLTNVAIQQVLVNLVSQELFDSGVPHSMPYAPSEQCLSSVKRQSHFG